LLSPDFASGRASAPDDQLEQETIMPSEPLNSARDSVTSSKSISTKGPNALLTAQEAAQYLRMSLSWLAKARMRGDGPAYVQVGRSIRYSETTLAQWMKSRQRLSTSEQ
jgi:predicted DNA-binding transcriptional regulator AlpA